MKAVNLKKCAVLLIAPAALIASCSFDYGTVSEDNDGPDIVMDNVEYVRVRGGDPTVRFKAEYAERWEDRQAMELRNFSFEQLEDHGETVNIIGRAGSASVRLSSGDVTMSGGVNINVDSEDITLITATLDWKDGDRTLAGGRNDKVDIIRSDGTSFSGIGLNVDARSKTWSFLGEVEGSYVEEDEDGEEGESAAEEDTGVSFPSPEPRPFIEEDTPLPAAEEK